MKCYICVIIFVISFHACEEQLSRSKRQFFNGFRPNSNGNLNQNNDADDEDEWFVFDVPQGLPPTRPRPRPRQTATTQGPFPNAGPPRLPPCEETCNARTTPQYNPVCGTNGNTYFNEARLDCARFCGNSVSVSHIGRCGPLLPSSRID